MDYKLPKSKDEFIERYKLREKIFCKGNNQYFIRNYSGLNNVNFDLNNSICNYLDNGNISTQSNWETNLEMQIKNFTERISHNDKILKQGEFSEKAVVIEKTYVQDEINGEIVTIDIGGGSGELYSEIGESINQFINEYGRLFFNYLGTEEKLLMCKTQKKYGLNDDNTNFLSEVQFNSKLLKKLSEFTKKMFDTDIYLDRYTWGDRILFRVGENFDFIRHSTREDNEVEYRLKDFKILDNEGDGVRNFVTSYLALNLNDKNIILLDEPESFLHPPLANQLGEIIGDSASEDKQIFISTHSVNLLKGILKSCDDINIIRITREGEINKINKIDQDYLKTILINPLLVSSNVLNGLFCEKVYICEAESDEEFYQLLHDKVNLLDSSLFVHGKNKQTLKDISEIYKQLEIENYRIYDFDILKDEDFNRAINNFIAKELKDNYIVIRKQINSQIEDRNAYNNKGIREIKEQTLVNNLNEMFDELKKNGIIILKNGCLETNLEDKGITFTGNKNKWFSDAINYLNNALPGEIKDSYIYKWIYEEAET